MTDEAEFPKTHNLVDVSLDDQAREEMREALVKANRRWAELDASFQRAPATIDDEDMAGRITTLIAQMGALLKVVDVEHERVKAPWLEASRAVDGVANTLREKVRAASSGLRERLTAYQTAKQARIEATRTAERVSYDQDPEPAWVDRAQQDRRHVAVRSDEGASAHLATDLAVTVDDPRKVPIRYLRRAKVLEAIAKEVKPDLLKGDKIAGVSTAEVKQSRVRRG